MDTYILQLQKMIVSPSEPVKYVLYTNSAELIVNDWLGKNVRITYQHEIKCLACARKTSKSFAQGYCYSCFIKVPETEDCVLRPELCRAHEGIARDMSFAQNHCLIPHFVYLANSGGVKVGITRHTQIPYRWIDQGASEAIIIAKVPNRFLSGMLELSLKKYFADKTNYRKMLCNQHDLVDMAEVKNKALNALPDEYKQYAHENSVIHTISYPVLQYLERVTSVTLEKHPQLGGKLIGIRGQYLLFDNGTAFNIRSHGGYMVQIEVD